MPVVVGAPVKEMIPEAETVLKSLGVRGMSAGKSTSTMQPASMGKLRANDTEPIDTSPTVFTLSPLLIKG